VFQIEKSGIEVRETSKLGGTKFISLFRVAEFTSFNCGLVTTQHISIGGFSKLEKLARKLPLKFEKL
jgi:hypothetical protein